ncbi:MAG: hypothetical protein AAGG75_10585 [Bacteroidota bacterium]
MIKNIAFLELKYGNIYGGYPNYYAISEAAFLVFEPKTNKIFLESMENTIDVDIVSVYSKVNELGNTIAKVREVVNLKTRRISPYDEEFKLSERELDNAFYRLRPSKHFLKNFLLKKCLMKYRPQVILTFDGRRDVFLCTKAGVNFDRVRIHDMQKDITKETNYLFSLNKLAKVIGFQATDTHLRSNGLEYWLHPIAARQIYPKTAAYDAARLFMIHQEYRENHEDFIMKAALLLNKIEMDKKVNG